MPGLKPCLDKHAQKLSKADKFDIVEARDKYMKEGLDETDASRKAVMDYHRDIHDRLNDLRKAVKENPSEYKPFDASDKIAEINKKFDSQREKVLSSSKTKINESKEESSKEIGGKEENSNAKGSQEKTPNEGNVKSEVGGETPLTPSKQAVVNDLMDKVTDFNSRTSFQGEAGAGKRSLLNEIRKGLPEGYTISYKNGHISGIKNEKGKTVQKRNDQTNKTEQAFDKSGYRPDTHDMVSKLASGEIPHYGIEVPGADGRLMSDRQKENAINDVKNGKDTLGAKALYDAFDKMPEGQIAVSDKVTGQKILVPIDEYRNAFKEPVKELSDDEITALNTELGEDAFDKSTDEIFNDLNNTENEPTANDKENKQPSKGAADSVQEKTGSNQENTGSTVPDQQRSQQPVGNQTEVSDTSDPNKAADAYAASAERLREDGDEDGAKLLEEQAEKIRSGDNSGLTGIKKAVIAAEREASGKTQLQAEFKRTHADVYDGAARLIKDNPGFVAAIRNMIDKTGRRLITPEEAVALSLRKMEIIQESKKVSKTISDAMASGDNGLETIARMKQMTLDIEKDNIDRIASETNYEKGLGLNVNKILIAEDYSAEVLKNRAAAMTADGKLTPEQEKKFDDLAQKLKEAQDRLQEHSEKIAKLEGEKAIQKIKAESDIEKRNTKRADKKEFLKKERKGLIDEFKKEIKGGTDNVQRSGLPLTDKMVAIVAKLAKNYVEDGITTLAGVVDNILNDLKEHAPDLDERQVRDAISGYSRPPRETYSDLSKKMGDIRKQAELVSKIEDVKSGLGVTEKEQKANGIPSPDTLKLRKELMEAMQQAGVDPYSEKAIKQFKTRLRKQRDDLQKKIRDGNYAKEVKKQIQGDKETAAMQTEIELLKHKVKTEINKIEKANRSKFEKRLDWFVKFRRAVILSGFSTLGKLTSAVAERSIITPMEEMAGEILQWIPGIKQISKMAPREGGGFNLGAELAAVSIFKNKNTLLEIQKMMKTGTNTMDILYGHQHDFPPEAIEFFNRLHGSFKTPAKLAEWSRAFEKRVNFAAQHGFDPLDPIQMTTLGTQAYADAMRAIFMQDNLATEGFKHLINFFENHGASGKLTAAMTRVLLPIVKVPTNFVWESSSYAVGAVKALPYVAKAMVKGVDSLTPDQADFVMRALKKQSLGLGILALGYFNPQAIGGYYTGKRKEGDLKAGDVEVFGVHIPHLVLHAPLIEMLQIGATLRRTHDAQEDKGEDVGKISEEGLIDAGKGLFGQVPFFNSAGTLGGAFKNAKSLEGFAGEMAKSLIVPPTVQQIAASKDTDEQGNPISRKPQNFIQHIEEGIPGLRQDVPTKSEDAAQKKEASKEQRDRKRAEKEASEEANQ